MAKKETPVDKNSKEFLVIQRDSSRLMILITVIFTVLNTVLLLCNANRFFLFAATLPYYVTWFGMLFDEGGVGSTTIAALVLAVIFLAIFLMGWVFSKKSRGWVRVMLIAYIVDTVALLVIFFALDMAVVSLLDIAIHFALVWEMVNLQRHDWKLRAVELRLRAEEEEKQRSLKKQGTENAP